VILGSGSPRRLELLRGIGVEPMIVAPDVDESVEVGESPVEYVRRLAAAKLSAVMHDLGPVAVGTVVIAADTTVDVDGRILAKPADAQEAVEMLRLLSGRSHRVHTGWAVAVAVPGCRGNEWEGHVEVTTSTVTFRSLTPAEVDAYVATGEPLDKAGAYAIQGGAGEFVEKLEGSLAAVVGLPVERIQDVCAGLGRPLS
jgi:septum formation protein